ncbi:MAG: DUF4065 domain-containing protein [Planctomycetes bacterium]|nr:DUF4065 domain-containing protein [Planctomycetota bacterium]
MFRFDFRKTVEAAGVLLRSRPPHMMGRVRLLKLLYLADRESLKETGAPITGDEAVAMKHGPVPSETYDLIKGEHIRTAEWSGFFENMDYYVRLANQPGTGSLSRYEIEKLNEIAERFENDDEWAVAEKTHDLPEWRKNDPGDSSRPIPFEDILEAVGRGAQIPEIRAEAQADEHFARLFGEV